MSTKIREVVGLTPTIDVIAEIQQERVRQVIEEGWTIEHDDQHELGEMADAASCYAAYSTRNYNTARMPVVWPWNFSWWKPTNPRRDLIKAAALIVAEIERLDRAESNGDSK